MRNTTQAEPIKKNRTLTMTVTMKDEGRSPESF